MRFQDVRKKLAAAKLEVVTLRATIAGRHCLTCRTAERPLILCGDDLVRCPACLRNELEAGLAELEHIAAGGDPSKLRAVELVELPAGMTEEQALAERGELVETEAHIEPPGWTERDRKLAEAWAPLIEGAQDDDEPGAELLANG